MTLFWIIVAGLALAVSAGLWRALLRDGSGARSAADYDIAVYRDQLAEVDRDLAKGVLTEEAAERIRLEVSRRILDADRARGPDTGATAPAAATWIVAAVTGAAVIGGSLATYLWLGAPGYGDLPLQARLEQSREFRDNRPDQVAAEAQAAAAMPLMPPPDPQHVALVQRLRDTLADRPDDLQGLTLLTQNEAALGNFAAAHEAQARRLALLGAAAQASDWADYADLLILAAGGYVSPQAEDALNETLDRDPENGPARYYAGLLYAQTGRPDLAFGIWRQLLERSDGDAPWVPAIRDQIEDVAARAGVRFELEPAQPVLAGPSQAQVDAASEMSVDERMQMIRGMVDGLSERLASQGGTPAEWSRLIGALGVLGEVDRARDIWREGREVFAGNTAALDMMQQAAGRAGVAQ